MSAVTHIETRACDETYLDKAHGPIAFLSIAHASEACALGEEGSEEVLEVRGGVRCRRRGR